MLRVGRRLLGLNLDPLPHLVQTFQNNEHALRIELNRPNVKNAFNAELIQSLTTSFRNVADAVKTDPKSPHLPVCVVLTGAGDAFSAGADLSYMASMVSFSEEENVKDAKALFDLFLAIATCPIPVIARVNGHAMGGGVGIVAAADVAVASSVATFGLTEVKLGLVPATISPFVARKIGAHTLRLFTTGERFSASTAHTVGLLSEAPVDAKDPDALDAAVTRYVKEFSSSGRLAVREAKALALSCGPDLASRREETARLIARLRTGEEAQKRLHAFLAKVNKPTQPK
eukprot:TRINITY_DN22899_c0_g1_i1.p1 TRINITY_DN22899_c0_g1~~TRINITY_DN22899_c0_g1_i1.p1  ORF type:complete len:287 (-),score=33.35 TRINITY_DN22899_c0_g1_i1:358-1218(-)